LATRGSSRIYEVLEHLQSVNSEQIRPELIAVLIKALLVHGAKQPDDVKSALTDALKTAQNSRSFKSVLSRYIGYGAVDIERVLACTEQRGTVLGCSEIHGNEIHEYRFPIPLGLSDQKVWRRMTVTLAWFTPLNIAHRHLREAKLAVASSTNWGKTELKLARQDADHNQVQRGTVQHEIFEGENQISAFQDGESIILHVTCKADATAKLDHTIPYGLAVTLEVAEGIAIPIYQQIRDRIRPQVVVGSR